MFWLLTVSHFPSPADVDMAPDFAGTLMGITNSLGNIAGFLAPVVAAQFTKRGPTVANWAWVFYISSGVYFVNTLLYCCFCTAQEQPWGRVKRDEPTEVKDKDVETINHSFNLSE